MPANAVSHRELHHARGHDPMHYHPVAVSLGSLYRAGAGFASFGGRFGRPPLAPCGQRVEPPVSGVPMALLLGLICMWVALIAAALWAAVAKARTMRLFCRF